MLTFIQGQRVKVTGLVIRAGASSFDITDGIMTLGIFGKPPPVAGEVVSLAGVVEDITNLRVRADMLEVLAGDESEEKKGEILEKLRNGIVLAEHDLMVQDKIMEELKPQFSELARHLLVAKKLNRYILLRFHNDADGIASAFALTSFLRCRAEQQNAAVYSTRDAVRDLNTLANEHAPLALFADFGASKESLEAIRLLKAAGVEIIIIDHHPPAEEVEETVDFFLSPWRIDTDEAVSQYTAGYMAAELARLTGTEGMEEYARISCAGDKSTILPIAQEDKDRALVIDFLAMYASYGNNLDFYKNVLRNEELFKSILQQAKEKMRQVSDAAMKLLKKHPCGEIAVYSVELEGLVKEHEFPSRGKVATMIFENIGNERPSIILGYGKRTLILRVNGLAVEAGFAADRLISEIKVTMKDFIESGGGHAKAAAVRTREGFSKTIGEALITRIKQKASEIE